MPEDPPTPTPEPRPWPQRLLWGLLALVLLAITAATVYQLVFQREPPEPPPVLGELPAFSFTDQQGQTVTLADLSGRPFVLDLIFTRCVVACPVMTRRLGQVEGPEGQPLQRVSISVDPEHDTPEILAEYAEARGVPAGWRFLTGDRDAIYRFAREGLQLAIDPDTGDPQNPIAHSTRFVLVDRAGRIRGYYDAFDREALDLLDGHLRALEKEAAAEGSTL